MNRSRSLVLGLALVAVASVAARPLVADQPATAAPTGFRGEFLNQLTDVEKKLTDLAQATPEAKFSWRPAEGVRSVAEVYNHVAVGNFFLMGFAGSKLPAGIERDTEKKVTEKAKVVEMLKGSFDHVRKGVSAMSDADLDKKVSVFGKEMTTRGLLLIISNHEHEHLGQSIAYARSNGIAPPWSEGPAPKK